MKKIGILTYQRAHNHGALLQAFALQKTLTNLGYYSELIDYRNIGTPEFYKENKSKKSNLLKLKGYYDLFKNIYFHRIKKKQASIFKNFQNNELTFSAKCYKTKQLLIEDKIERFYDAIIAGSDQIWNLDISLNDTTYYLDFFNDKKKKITYAASFGKSSINDTMLKKLSPLFKTIKYLSVRETEGAKIIKKSSGIEAEVVLDPTMLLSKTDWMTFVKTPRISYPYILCYVIGYCSKQTMDLCQDIHRKHNLSIVMIGNSAPKDRIFKNVKFINNLDPFEFIGYIFNAKIVISSSFHGSVFSIIFNKPFYSLPSKMKDINSSRNSRLISLLTILKLENRYLDTNAKYPTREDLIIDYAIANKRLLEERTKSINFLKYSLSEI